MEGRVIADYTSSDKARYCLGCRTIMPPGTRYFAHRQFHYPDCDHPEIEHPEAPDGLISRNEFDRIVRGYIGRKPVLPKRSRRPPSPEVRVKIAPAPGEPGFIGPRAYGTNYRWPTVTKEELVAPGTFGTPIAENVEASIAEMLVTHKDEGVVLLPYQVQCIECMNPMYRGTLAILGTTVNTTTEKALARHFNWLDKRGQHHGCSYHRSVEGQVPGRVIHAKKRPGADGEQIVDEPTTSHPIQRRGNSNGYMHHEGSLSEGGPAPKATPERSLHTQ